MTYNPGDDLSLRIAEIYWGTNLSPEQVVARAVERELDMQLGTFLDSANLADWKTVWTSEKVTEAVGDYHDGDIPEHLQRRATRYVMVLEELADDDEVDAAQRRLCAERLLDQSGYKPKEEVQITEKHEFKDAGLEGIIEFLEEQGWLCGHCGEPLAIDIGSVRGDALS